MAAVDPYAGDTARKFTASNWAEVASNFSPNGAALFGPNGGEAVLVGNVDTARSIAAARFFLGYSNVYPVYNESPAPVGGWELNRTPPVYHPRYPRLVCTSVGLDDYRLYPQLISGSRRIKVPEITLPALPAGAPADYNTIDGTSLGYLTSYQKTKLTARFAPVPYRMLGDTAIGIGANRAEWMRWTYIDQEPRVEILSLTGFQQKYYEGSGFTTPNSVANPTSNPLGNEFPAEIGQAIVKSDLRVNWLSVPEEWIFYRDTATQRLTTIPTKIVAGLGCVNSLNFLGYLAGTLLLNGVKLIRRPWPLAAGTESRFNWDVEFSMSYFDPTKGYSSIAGVPTQLVRVDGAGEPTDPRGHNCFPWRGSGFADDRNAGLWFGASYTGAAPSATNRSSFATYDFRKLFSSPLNPAIP